MRSSCTLAGAFEPKGLVHQEPLPIERKRDHRAERKVWDNFARRAATWLTINRIQINAPMISMAWRQQPRSSPPLIFG